MIKLRARWGVVEKSESQIKHGGLMVVRSKCAICVQTWTKFGTVVETLQMTVEKMSNIERNNYFIRKTEQILWKN